jgi:hypothetical protein
MAIRPLETEHNQESNIAGPSEVLQPLAKQTSSLVNLEKRVPTSSKGATVASTVIMYGGTAPSPGRAIETAEIYEGSDEWGMDNPEDWAAILLEMRNNVQDLAVSLLGQDQLSSRVSNPSGSKVCFTAYYSHFFSGLMKTRFRELIRQAVTILRSNYEGWRTTC